MLLQNEGFFIDLSFDYQLFVYHQLFQSLKTDGNVVDFFKVADEFDIRIH